MNRGRLFCGRTKKSSISSATCFLFLLHSSTKQLYIISFSPTSVNNQLYYNWRSRRTQLTKYFLKKKERNKIGPCMLGVHYLYNSLLGSNILISNVYIGSYMIYITCNRNTCYLLDGFVTVSVHQTNALTKIQKS